MKNPRMLPQISRPGNHPRREMELKTAVSFRIGHEQDTGPPCQPVKPAERGGKGSNRQGCQAVNGAPQEQQNPHYSPDHPDCPYNDILPGITLPARLTSMSILAPRNPVPALLHPTDSGACTAYSI